MTFFKRFFETERLSADKKGVIGALILRKTKMNPQNVNFMMYLFLLSETNHSFELISESILRNCGVNKLRIYSS